MLETTLVGTLREIKGLKPNAETPLSPVQKTEGAEAIRRVFSLLSQHEWIEDDLIQNVLGYVAKEVRIQEAKRLKEHFRRFEQEEAMTLLLLLFP